MSSQCDLWKDFGKEFKQLAREEEQIEQAAPKDRWLRAYCSYREHPEVWETGKPEQGLFCLLKTPECGVWVIGDGVNENFQERFRTLAARTGVTLGSPKGTDPEDFWLHRLFLDLRENNSDQLFAASDEGGVIRRVCKASATFCSRLERKALESLASRSKREKKHNGPSPFREIAAGRNSSWRRPESTGSSSRLQTKTLQKMLTRTENRLQYLKDKFPDWCSFPRPLHVIPQAFNYLRVQPPGHCKEIWRLDEERDRIILELSKRNTLEPDNKSTSPTIERAAIGKGRKLTEKNAAGSIEENALKLDQSEESLNLGEKMPKRNAGVGTRQPTTLPFTPHMPLSNPLTAEDKGGHAMIWIEPFLMAIPDRLPSQLWNRRKAFVRYFGQSRRTGVNNVVGGPIAQIGINVENGEGRINLIRTTRSSNGVILDWVDHLEPGSYTVDPDCTGTFFNKSQNLVVLDGGKRYFLLSVAPGTTVTEEGTRIEEEKKD